MNSVELSILSKKCVLFLNIIYAMITLNEEPSNLQVCDAHAQKVWS